MHGIGFPAIPGVRASAAGNHITVFGDWVRPEHQAGKTCATLMPSVDADGNETAGIRLPPRPRRRSSRIGADSSRLGVRRERPPRRRSEGMNVNPVLDTAMVDFLTRFDELRHKDLADKVLHDGREVEEGAVVEFLHVLRRLVEAAPKA